MDSFEHDIAAVIDMADWLRDHRGTDPDPNAGAMAIPASTRRQRLTATAA